MIYKAVCYHDQRLKEIPDGHTETFESNYQIRAGDSFIFKNITGSFKVTSITHKIGILNDAANVELLCIPDVRFAF